MPLPCEMVPCWHSALLLVQYKVMVLAQLHFTFDDLFTVPGYATRTQTRNEDLLLLGIVGWARISPLLSSPFFLMPMCFQNAAFPAATCCSPPFSEFVDSLGGRRDRSRGHHINPSCASLNVTLPISDRSPLQVGGDFLGVCFYITQLYSWNINF